MKKIPLLIMSLLLVAGHASATSAAICESGHSVASVQADGHIVVLDNYAVYQVLGKGTVDPSLWLPGSDVIVCDAKHLMVNVSDGEKAKVRRLW